MGLDRQRKNPFETKIVNQLKPPILLFPTHYLGNFVLGLPWVLEVLKHYPDSLVVLDAQFEGMAKLVLPANTRLLLYPRKQIARNQKLSTRLRHYWRFLRALRSSGADTVLDLEGERFTGVLARLSGCKRRVGPTGKRAARFYTDILDLDYENHRFNAFGEIVADYVTGDIPSSHVPYTIDEASVKSVQEKLGTGNREKPLVAIHPGASVPYKLWSQDYFVELVSELRDRGLEVVWVGAGEMDSRIIEAIEEKLESQALNLCNKLSFVELISLYRQCRFFVGSDSGPMHLAASTGLPVFALFGPSKEAIWAPLGDNSTMLRGTDPCGSNCDAFECDYAYRCLQSLRPSAIIAAVQEKAL